MTTILRLATKAGEERASAEDLEELAMLVLELDEALVVDGVPMPARWSKPPSKPRDRRG